MSVLTFRTALAAALDGISNMRCSLYMTDQVRPPQAMIDMEVNYDLVFARGADTYTFHVMVFDQRKSEREAQERIDLWRDGTSTSSLKYIIENDAGVAAVCDYARVVSAGRPQVITVGAVDYLMTDFEIEVVL